MNRISGPFIRYPSADFQIVLISSGIKGIRISSLLSGIRPQTFRLCSNARIKGWDKPNFWPFYPVSARNLQIVLKRTYKRDPVIRPFYPGFVLKHSDCHQAQVLKWSGYLAFYPVSVRKPLDCAQTLG